jgi:hypothetical protein
VLFGPGGAGLHSAEEYVNVSDVIACRDALASLALQLTDVSTRAAERHASQNRTDQLTG